MRALSFFRRPAAVCLALALVLPGVCWSPGAMAVSCNDSGISNLNFGNVNLLNDGVVNATATLTFGCNAQPGDQILVCVGVGPNPTAPGMGNFIPRYLRLNSSGSQPTYLAFNLYSDPAYTNIWGDFGSNYQPQAFVMHMGEKWYLTETLTAYGQIRTHGQTGLPSGRYDANNWPIHIRYQTFTGATPPTCSAGGMSESSSAIPYISATVKSDCRIDTVSDLDFGTVFQTLDQNVDSTAIITITCTGAHSWPGGGYQVMLGDGLHASGEQRRMQGPGGAFLDYGLYMDAARTERWGDTAQTGVSQNGNGQPQQLRVYGRVPPQAVSAAGNYSDTVVVTVSY